MSGETKLLPCPFCGSEGEPHENANSPDAGLHWIRCKSCGADGHCETPDAIAAWNRRASLKAVPEVEVVKLEWKWELERHARVACDSDDDAKASAQSYFEARIRSCLAQPAPDAEVKP